MKLAQAERESIETIAGYGSLHEPVYINTSGGRHSSVLLDLASRSLDDVYALYIDTTQSLPECTDYVKWLCRELGVDLVILKRAGIDMFGLMKKWGFPRRNLRWCMEEFKSWPLRLFNQSRDENSLHLVGVSMHESTIRMKVYAVRGEYYFNRHIGAFVLNPLLNWKDDMVEEYMRKHRIPENSSYSIYESGGNCFYCPFVTSRNYYARLARLEPERFQTIVDTEQSMRNGGAAIYVPGGELIHMSEIEPETDEVHLETRLAEHRGGCSRIQCACGTYD